MNKTLEQLALEKYPENAERYDLGSGFYINEYSQSNAQKRKAFTEGAQAYTQSLEFVELLRECCMCVLNRINREAGKDYSDIATEAYQQWLQARKEKGE